MPRKFRLTCARRTCFDLELAAEDAAEAERLLEAAIAGNPGLCDSGRPIGRPPHRIVEIAAAGEVSTGLHEEAA